MPFGTNQWDTQNNTALTTGYQGGNPDFFGTGQYQAPIYDINQNAFNNPNYVPGQYQGALNNYLGSTTGNINAAQAGPGNYGNFNMGVGGEAALAGRYGQMAAGNGPSLAEVTARQQGAQNIANTQSMLGSARGAGNPAQAQLAARNAAATGQQNIAQNAVAGRTQEELGAMGAQGALYGQIAGQGLSQVQTQQELGQFNAGQQNAIAQANQANRLAAYSNYLQSTGQQGLAQQQGTMAGQQLGSQTALGYGQIQSGAYNSAAERQQKMAGGFLGGIGGLLGGIL